MTFNQAIQDLHRTGICILSNNPQIIDIKEIEAVLKTYKNKCLQAIHAYKHWKKEYSQQTETVEILYGGIEGIMLRRQAEDAVKLYWVMRQDIYSSLKAKETRIFRHSDLYETVASI